MKDVQIKCMSRMMVIVGLTLVIVFGAAANVMAKTFHVGESIEKQGVEVKLIGVDSYGAVQVFNFLLNDMSEKAEQRGMQIVGGDPSVCWVDWSLSKEKDDAATISAVLFNNIKKLDPDKKNDILWKATFDVNKEDLELVKQIVPISINFKYILFGVKGRKYNQAGQHSLALGSRVSQLQQQRTDLGFE